MYLEYFNLTHKPFELVPNPKFLFMSRTHRRAMNYLQYGLQERAGFILLSGDIGAGKTTLLKELVSRLDDQTVISRVFNTRVEPLQLLEMINLDFGLEVTSRDKVALMRNLNNFLIDCYSRNRRALLIIDEAQNLSIEALEEVRLLSNLESNSDKLLQVIMVGQPELQAKLYQPSLEQLRQRLSVSCHLGALNEEEVSEYFYHRLECAGNRAAVTLPENSFNAIHAICRGVPRLINVFGDYLLLAAFSDKRKKLTRSFISEVIADLQETVAFRIEEPMDEIEIFNQGTNHFDQLYALQKFEQKHHMHEEVMKKIIRKQVEQTNLIKERLEGIEKKLHSIESSVMSFVSNGNVKADISANALPVVVKKVQ